MTSTELSTQKGNKEYELTNHLGNVMTTVSDKKIAYSSAPEIVNIFSNFDGNDYDKFVNGDYSAFMAFDQLNSSNSVIKLNGGTGQVFGPSMIIPVKEGDVINIDIKLYYENEPYSSIFVYSLTDESGNILQENGQGIWAGLSTNVTGSWQNKSLTRTVTVPLNGQTAYLRIYPWKPADRLYSTWFDDLSVEIIPSDDIFYKADVITAQDY